jgi:hypothetical protein
MKKTVCATFLLLLIMVTIGADEPSSKFQKYTIREREYLFSNYFEFMPEIGPLETVVKKRYAGLHVTDNYAVYDGKGVWNASGSCRIFCLGLLYSWATEIDVYDQNGKQIGLIDGQVATTAAARFSIYEYDAEGVAQLKAIAFMDNEKRSFSIVHPDNYKHSIAFLWRIFLPDLRDHWECQVYEGDLLDPRIIKVFAAFAVDHQEFFRPDN